MVCLRHWINVCWMRQWTQVNKEESLYFFCFQFFCSIESFKNFFFLLWKPYPQCECIWRQKVIKVRWGHEGKALTEQAWWPYKKRDTASLSTCTHHGEAMWGQGTRWPPARQKARLTKAGHAGTLVPDCPTYRTEKWISVVLGYAVWYGTCYSLNICVTSKLMCWDPNPEKWWY